MARLFVAADLPDEVRDLLIAVQAAPRAGMRLTPRHELHLTLHFLGEVKDDQLPAIHQTLGKVRLEGVGRFPEDGPAQVLWAGVPISWFSLYGSV